MFRVSGKVIWGSGSRHSVMNQVCRLLQLSEATSLKQKIERGRGERQRSRRLAVRPKSYLSGGSKLPTTHKGFTFVGPAPSIPISRRVTFNQNDQR